MFIIGITGGTASGKTTIVKKLTANFNSNDICVISQDSYYKRTYNLTIEERINQNFDHPDALDLHLLQFHLETLKSNHSIEMPIYSFSIHNRLLGTQTIKPKKIIIVEGILIFNHKRLLDLFDLKIFIHADADERLLRRIHRDTNERERDIKEVTYRYRTTLKPMHNIFIEPFKKISDYIFNNTDLENTIVKDLTNIIQERIQTK